MSKVVQCYIECVLCWLEVTYACIWLFSWTLLTRSEKTCGVGVVVKTVVDVPSKKNANLFMILKIKQCLYVIRGSCAETMLKAPKLLQNPVMRFA